MQTHTLMRLNGQLALIAPGNIEVDLVGQTGGIAVGYYIACARIGLLPITPHQDASTVRLKRKPALRAQRNHAMRQ